MGVLVAGALALPAGLSGAFRRRRSWLLAAAIGARVAANGIFWSWSLLSAGI